MNIEVKNKRVNFERLENFGFKKENGKFVYRTDLPLCRMEMTVCINESGEVSAEVTDGGEEYVLHHVTGAVGAFVGQVRAEYDDVLENIFKNCFDTDVFKSDYTKKVLEYAGKKYGDSPEYLWEKFPENAVLRRRDSGKWYAAVLTVKADRLGFDSAESIEIIDLNATAERVAEIVDNKKYFPGYHMNKKYWYSIVLDGSVPFEDICAKIDESYEKAKK